MTSQALASPGRTSPGRQGGAGASSLDLQRSSGRELVVPQEDQLALLLGELKRIEGQQNTLQTAVQQNKAIVVVPRREVLESEEEPDEPKGPEPKKQNVVSGGLVGFSVAEDLLNIDFSPPEEAPEEFRARPYNAAAPPQMLKSGVSGSFGSMDPTSAELGRFLQRLAMQQQQVMELIKEKEIEFRARMAGRPYTPPRPIDRGLSGMGSFGLASMGFPSASSSASPLPGSRLGGLGSAGRPQGSNLRPTAGTAAGAAAGMAAGTAAAASAARPSAADSRGGVQPGGVVPGARPMGPVAGAGANAELAVSRPPKQAPLALPKPIDWAAPPIIELKFAVAQRKVTSSRSVSANLDILGCLTYLFFIASFGFYAYVRIGRTVSGHKSIGIVVYEVIMLAAEALVFLSSALYGLCRVRSYRSRKPGWWARRRVRNAAAAQDRKESKEAAAVSKATNGTASPDGTVASEGTKGAAKPKHKAKPRWASTEPEEPVGDAHVAVQSPWHVQVLVYSNSGNHTRIKECLSAAHAMTVPAPCTRTIHLIDPAMDEAKQQLVQGLGLESVQYTACKPDAVHPATDNGRMRAINLACKQLYPKTSPAGPLEVLAFFDDDQVADVAYLERMLVRLEVPSVKLVHCRIGYVNLSPSSDVYNQMEEHYNRCMLPGLEPWGYGSSSTSGFIARVDALQKTGWLPAYADAGGFSFGLEARIAQLDTVLVDQVLITGIAPTSVKGVYASKGSAAREHLQAHVRARPGYRGQLSLESKLIYHVHAISEHVSAITVVLFVVVPILRVLFNIFPFSPNRWFGLAFLAYYVIATPLLYKGYSPQHLRSWWIWVLSSRLLWFTNLRALSHTLLRLFKPYTSIPGYKPPPRKNLLSGKPTTAAKAVKQAGKSITENIKEKAREKQLQKEQAAREARERDAEAGNGEVPGAYTAKQAKKDEKEKKKAALANGTVPPRAPREIGFPWLALLICVISGACCGIGVWLLFGTHGVVSGSLTEGVSLVSLANNLTLIISTLWCMVNTVIFAIPVIYALGAAGPQTYDADRSTRSPGREHGGRGFLAFLSYLALVLAIVSAVIIAAACLGLGQGFTGAGGMSGAVKPDYGKALRYSMYFYQAQKSGALTGDSNVDWRGSSATSDVPAGGWYLGSNNLKLTFPMAIAAGQIAWGLSASPKGYASSGQGLDYAVDNLQWASNYLGLCAANATYFVAQVGDVATEQGVWARPEDETAVLRPTSTLTPLAPGSDLTGAAVAALAATAVALRSKAYGYSVAALDTATSLYPAMVANEGLWSDSYADASAVYPSSTFLDDMMLAAAWMNAATGTASYLTQAAGYFQRIQAAPGSYQTVNYNWDNQYYAACLLMWQLTRESVYQQEVETFLNWWLEGDNGVTYTPNGLAYTQSGAPLRDAANAAFLALAYGDKLQGGSSYYRGRKYACWGILQLRYILGGKSGKTSGGQSFMVGYGANPPQRAANPAASCPASLTNCNSPIGSSEAYTSSEPNPHVLYGALVAGPDGNDNYDDVRTSAFNDVNIEYNGGLSAALAIAAGHDWSVCDERNGFFDQIGVHKKLSSRLLQPGSVSRTQTLHVESSL